MTTTIILITWILAGILSNIIVVLDIKDDIRIKDISAILLLLILGYMSLIIIITILISERITLPKIKLPKGDKVIWKYPKKK